jgi:TolB protein
MKASPFLKIILLPVALSLLFFAAGCASLSAQPPSTSLSASLSSTASNDSSRVILSSPPVDALPAPAPRLDGQIIAAVEENGQTNILAASADGSAWASVARDYAPARDPALSPDGTRIAFRSHRDGNWEIYVLNLNAGAQAKPARLTNVKAYDGAPAWSPDGTRLAFESYRAGDLDLWVMQADGANPTNLTEKSGSADFAPAWSPDGKWIAFVSFRTGHKQIFVVAPEHPNVPPTNLSQNDWNDEQPTWSPDGKQLAFVSDRDGQGAIYVMDFDLTKRAPATRLTYSGADFPPRGRRMANTSRSFPRVPIVSRFL